MNAFFPRSRFVNNDLQKVRFGSPKNMILRLSLLFAALLPLTFPAIFFLGPFPLVPLILGRTCDILSLS